MPKVKVLTTQEITLDHDEWSCVVHLHSMIGKLLLEPYVQTAWRELDDLISEIETMVGKLNGDE